MRQSSDPSMPDRARFGDDLLLRIDELTVGRIPEGGDGNGWRPLLVACGREIELRGIAERIRQNEEKRS